MFRRSDGKELGVISGRTGETMVLGFLAGSGWVSDRLYVLPLPERRSVLGCWIA